MQNCFISYARLHKAEKAKKGQQKELAQGYSSYDLMHNYKSKINQDG